ncbi:MAG: NERD domain-containing protein [Kiritimatiellae bacterium]|nr:NERD domain-containing protein [Kiritimatiellia bacterium]
MAEMIPEWFTQGPAAELQVWRALRAHLPETWTVWHSLSYSSIISPEQSPGEIDFLCYHRDHGLIAIEVKGGELRFENGRWFQDEHVLKRSPFKQVTMAGCALATYLCQKWEVQTLPFPIGHLVWFPSVSRLQEEPFEGAGTTLYAEDLAHPEQSLLRHLKVTRMTHRGPDAAYLKAALTPVTEYRKDWQQRRSLADARLTKLTLEQARTLDAFSQFPRLRVRGCAGSGKTLLALRRTFQLAAQGKRVLLICFNLLLAAHLRRLAGDTPGVRIEAVNDLFLTLLGRKVTNDPEFWHQLAKDVVPVAATFAQEAVYDAVIVDEGQDFSPLVWDAVKVMVPPEADFIVFYDPAQNIFQRNLSAMPEFPWPEAVLTQNCRNTRAVGMLLQPYAPENMIIPEEAPAGERPEVYSATSRVAIRERLHALLTRLIGQEDIPQGDIVLMGAHARQKMMLEAVERDFPEIKYFTYRKFKGLEAPVLILIDVDERNPLWDVSARYTAISRAVHKLIVLNLIPETSTSASG